MESLLCSPTDSVQILMCDSSDRSEVCRDSIWKSLTCEIVVQLVENALEKLVWSTGVMFLIHEMTNEIPNTILTARFLNIQDKTRTSEPLPFFALKMLCVAG